MPLRLVRLIQQANGVQYLLIMRCASWPAAFPRFHTPYLVGDLTQQIDELRLLRQLRLIMPRAPLLWHKVAASLLFAPLSLLLLHDDVVEAHELVDHRCLELLVRVMDDALLLLQELDLAL